MEKYFCNVSKNEFVPYDKHNFRDDLYSIMHEFKWDSTDNIFFVHAGMREFFSYEKLPNIMMIKDIEVNTKFKLTEEVCKLYVPKLKIDHVSNWVDNRCTLC